MEKPFWKKIDRIVGAIFVVGLVVYFVAGKKDCEAISKEVVAELAAEFDAIDERTDIGYSDKSRLKQQIGSMGTRRERMKEAGCERWFLDTR